MHGVVKCHQHARNGVSLGGDDAFRIGRAVVKGHQQIGRRLGVCVLRHLDRLIWKRVFHSAAHINGAVRNGFRRGRDRSCEPRDTGGTGADDRAGRGQKLTQVFPPGRHRQPSVYWDGCDFTVDGVGERPADDVCQHRGKQVPVVQPAVMPGFCDQAHAGHAGQAELVLSQPGNVLQKLRNNEVSLVRPADGRGIGERGKVLVAQLGDHKQAVRCLVQLDIVVGAVLQQRRGVVPDIRLQSVIGQLIAHHRGGLVAGRGLDLAVRVLLAVIVDDINCHWSPPPGGAGGPAA